MINRRRFLQHVVGSTTALLMAQGCTGTRVAPTPAMPPAPPSSSTQESELVSAGPPDSRVRVGFSGVPKQLDPALSSVLEEYQLGFALFDGLVWADETLRPQPLLATAWETSSNLLRWTFTLEQGVTFHHGAPLTAMDVVYTFTRLRDPKLGSSFRSVLRFVERVEALDDYTVRFHLATPNVELPLLLASPQASIVCHDYAADMMNKRPSGTGPFRFVEFIPTERIRLARNEAYWAAEENYVDELEYLYLSYEEQMKALQTGELDVVSQLGTDDLSRLANDPAIQVVTAQSGSYQTIVMQATEAPFTDPRVRQALKYCADHSVLRQHVLQGNGVVANNHPVAPISPFWVDLPQHEQNIAKAKTLLAQAGYAKGLRLDLVSSTARPGMMELALAFREMARPAGVEIQVVRVPADVYWSDYSGQTPFHIGNWGFRPSIDETFMVAYHSTAKGNESRWKNAALDALIDEARTKRNEAERKAIYQQAQQLIWEEGAVIIPYFKPVAIALRRNIQGFILHPAGWLDFSTVSVIGS